MHIVLFLPYNHVPHPHVENTIIVVLMTFGLDLHRLSRLITIDIVIDCAAMDSTRLQNVVLYL